MLTLPWLQPTSTGRAGVEIGKISMEAMDGVKIAGGATETGGGSENAGTVTDSVGIDGVSTLGWDIAGVDTVAAGTDGVSTLG